MNTQMEIAMDTAVRTPPQEAAAPSVAEAELPLIAIRPAVGWQPVNVRELWQYRELLAFLVWRDVKVRYKQTLLGAAWAVLQPMMMMVVFTVFFAKMAGISSGDLPYPIFCYLGLLPWTFFSTAISNAGNSVVGSERLITKIYFPRLAVPFAAVGAAIVDFFIAFSLLIVMMLWYGVHPGLSSLMVPVILLIIMLMALGVGTLLAGLNVAYRDFRYVIPFLVQLWLFATPSIYSPVGQAKGGAMRALLALNPMTGLISAFRAACRGGAIPWAQLGISAAVAVVVFLFGCLHFRRMERTFADII
jgi:homopolymeric O-antigen transport system permease protein